MSTKPPEKAHVMVLGTYHMGNPGLDIANVKADDVLVPKRQKEIAEVIEVLKKFRPTKVVIEAPLGDAAAQKRYQDYVAGTYELRRNESEQFGFRLAKELGHKAIYPVDVKGEFPFEAIQAFAEKNGRQAQLGELMAIVQQEVDKISKSLETNTILGTLRMMNDPKEITGGQAFYMKMTSFASPDNYAGPDLLAEWYKRNIRISANIHALIESPKERILVIYGQGHSYWLQRNVLDSDDMTLDIFK